MTTMITVSEDQTFALSNTHFSYVFRVSPEGILEHLHYGGALSNPLKVSAHHKRTIRHVASTFQGGKHYSLSDTPQEYPSFGTSDYRFPAVHGRNSDGNTVFSLHYKKHRIVSEKPKIKGLPSARGGGSETLILTLQDPLHRLRVELSYTIWEDHGVIARSVKFKNLGENEIQLQHALLGRGSSMRSAYRFRMAASCPIARAERPAQRTIHTWRCCKRARPNPMAAVMVRPWSIPEISRSTSKRVSLRMFGFWRGLIPIISIGD